jgi:zinc/manganese transport system substrate-binding protein
MLTRRTLLAASALALLLAPAAYADPALKAVVSFSILGDFVSEVGGDRVTVTTLVGPDGDAHVYQPTPADAEAVAGAGIVFVNGLHFEGWMDRLISASGTKAPIVVATEGITPRVFGEGDPGEEEHAEEEAEEGEAHAEHDHGPIDPHAWQSVPNAKIYVANIARALSDVDPAGAETYAANAAAYTAKLDALDAEIRTAVAAIPENRRTIVTSHDAFGYFAQAYGLTFEAPQGLSTESEASAADVAKLITQIRAQNVPAIFMENITDPRLLEQIVSETDTKIGGTLYSDALSGPDGPAATYLDMMENNIHQFSASLGS